MIGHAGCDQAEHGPGGLRGGGLPLAAEFGPLVGIGRLAPAAVGLLMGQEPLGPGHHGRIVLRHADLDQAGQGLPGSVDIVDAPAAEPASVGLLGAANELDGPIDVRIAQRGGRVCPGPPAPGRKGRPCWGRSWRCDRRRARSRGSGDRCCGRTRPNRRRDSAWPTSTAGRARWQRPILCSAGRLARPRASGRALACCLDGVGPLLAWSSSRKRVCRAISDMAVSSTSG